MKKNSSESGTEASSEVSDNKAQENVRKMELCLLFGLLLLFFIVVIRSVIVVVGLSLNGSLNNREMFTSWEG